jgi:hypothetical protein
LLSKRSKGILIAYPVLLVQPEEHSQVQLVVHQHTQVQVFFSVVVLAVQAALVLLAGIKLNPPHKTQPLHFFKHLQEGRQELQVLPSGETVVQGLNCINLYFLLAVQEVAHLLMELQKEVMEVRVDLAQAAAVVVLAAPMAAVLVVRAVQVW